MQFELKLVSNVPELVMSSSGNVAGSSHTFGKYLGSMLPQCAIGAGTHPPAHATGAESMPSSPQCLSEAPSQTSVLGSQVLQVKVACIAPACQAGAAVACQATSAVACNSEGTDLVVEEREHGCNAVCA